jgi:hypothetical protein
VVVVAWWANGGGCSLAELRLSPTIFILPCWLRKTVEVWTRCNNHLDPRPVLT